MAENPLIVARRARVVTLREAGMSYPEIGRQEVRDAQERGEVVPERSPGAIAMDYTRVMKARKKLAEETGEFDATLELQRLDSLQTVNEAVLRGAQRGRCVTCGRVPDPELVLKATDRLLKISERRAQLRGLDLAKRPITASPAAEDPVALIKKRIGLSVVR